MSSKTPSKPAAKPQTAVAAGASMAPPKAPLTPPPSPSTMLRRADNGVERNAKPQLGAEPQALEQGEFVRTVWCATVPAGVRPEALLDPTFWAHHAVKFTPWAKIEARALDGSWYAEYVVLDCSRTWAKVKAVVGPVFLGTQDTSLTEAAQQEESEKQISQIAALHTVEFNTTDKWRVVRKADKVVLTKGRTQRDEAEKWLRAHALHELGKGKPADEVVPA